MKNDLEKALDGDNSSLSDYLGDVSVEDFRAHIAEIISKHSNPDTKALKERIKAAIDNA